MKVAGYFFFILLNGCYGKYAFNFSRIYDEIILEKCMLFLLPKKSDYKNCRKKSFPYNLTLFEFYMLMYMFRNLFSYKAKIVF